PLGIERRVQQIARAFPHFAYRSGARRQGSRAVKKGRPGSVPERFGTKAVLEACRGCSGCRVPAGNAEGESEPRGDRTHDPRLKRPGRLVGRGGRDSQVLATAEIPGTTIPRVIKIWQVFLSRLLLPC